MQSAPKDHLPSNFFYFHFRNVRKTSCMKNINFLSNEKKSHLVVFRTRMKFLYRLPFSIRFSSIFLENSRVRPSPWSEKIPQTRKIECDQTWPYKSLIFHFLLTLTIWTYVLFEIMHTYLHTHALCHLSYNLGFHLNSSKAAQRQGGIFQNLLCVVII